MKFTYHPFSSVMIAAAVWLALLPLGALIEPSAFILETVPLLVVSGVVGLGLALLRAPRPVSLIVQLVAVCAVLVWRGLGLAGAGGLIDSLVLLTSDGVEAIRSQAPPLVASPGTTWLVLLLAAVLTLVLELLVNGLEQPGWAVAPLSLAFVMSSLIVRDDLSALQAAPVIGGYLLVLLSSSGPGSATGTASRSGPFQASRAATSTGLAVIALVVSMLVAPLVPLGPKQPWNNSGPDGPIQLADPTVRLNQDLLRPEDSPVLTYRPDNDQPTYLRTVALSTVTAEGARLLPMRLSRFGVDGAYDYPGERVKLDVQMADVPSEYLPVPFAVNDFNAAGAWSYDPDTLSVVAAGRDRMEQTRNLSYSTDSTLPNPTRQEIEAAGAGGGLNPVLSEIPEGLDPQVSTLTSEVVADAETAGQKALAIQSYLRSDAFTYSLDAPGTSDSNAINSFLLSDQSGYCIHFSAAMIVMARMQGIPSRMAVGFAPGERQDDGSYQVTSHDAHAWPELYFEGLGWVPFEPTPAFSGDPDNTDPASQPSASPSPEPSPSPSSAPAEPSATPTPTAAPDEPSGTPDEGAGWLGGLGWVALVLLLLACPAFTRIVQRRLRLRPGRDSTELTDGAWDEARATLRDYGRQWPPGSPGPVALSLAGELPGEAAAALGAIARTVERSRFSRDAGNPENLAAQVSALRASLRTEASRGRRLLALALPPSLLPTGLSAPRTGD